MSSVGGIGRSKGTAADTASDFASVAMRTIRALQKQLRDIGEVYQQELLHPHAAGSAEQDLLRDLARQMAGIKQEIEAEENAILEHQALVALKRRHADEKNRLPEPASARVVPEITAVDRTTRADAPDTAAVNDSGAAAQPRSAPGVSDASGSPGQNIDTEA